MTESNNSLQSTKKWEEFGIDQKLIDVLKREHYDTPSKTQEKFLTELSKDPNISGMCEAPTGTGKTLAYIIAAVQKIKQEKKATQVVILSHT